MAVLLLLAGCGMPAPRRPDSAETDDLRSARRMLARLAAQNAGLDTFKGIGRIRWQRGAETFTGRMAWAGAGGGRLRVQVLAVTGQPFLSLVDDGRQLTVVAHGPQRSFTTRSDGQNLTSALSLPVGSDDIFALLAGRLIVRDHYRVQWQPDTEKPLTVLLLQGRFGGRVEAIHLAPDGSRVLGLDLFGGGADPALRVRFEAVQIVDGFQVPRRLTLSGREGHRLTLAAERYWVNVPLAPDVFRAPAVQSSLPHQARPAPAVLFADVCR